MNIPVEKNNEYIVDIIDNGSEGEGIARIDNFIIFIPGCLKSEKVKIVIVKVLSSHAFGKIVEIIKKSEDRVEPDCTTYKRCGGCSLRHVKYEKTLEMKREKVQTLVNKVLKNKVIVEKTEGMENPCFYRNKAQYPVGLSKEGKPVMGVFANRTHEIVPIKTCYIQNEQGEKIAKDIFEYLIDQKVSVYNEKSRKGLIRHIVIKVGVRTNEIMCVLVINGENISCEKELVKYLSSKYPNIKTIVKNINKRETNVILGEKNINLYGNGYIEDRMGEYMFKISPLSFYQVNPIQAEKLYNIGVKAANITKEDTVFDLYCGIGTISIFMAKYAKEVYGIEIVEEAIEMAEDNAKQNNINNTKFYAGDVKVLLNELIYEKNIVPDIIMVDPPRKGLDDTSVEDILKISPKKVIYISCNPATLVRDLAKMEDKYEIFNIKPVDLFPFTSHVECVVCLKLK